MLVTPRDVKKPSALALSINSRAGCDPYFSTISLAISFVFILPLFFSGLFSARNTDRAPCGAFGLAVAIAITLHIYYKVRWIAHLNKRFLIGIAGIVPFIAADFAHIHLLSSFGLIDY